MPVSPLSGAIFIGVLLLILIALPEVQGLALHALEKKDRATLINEYRRTLAQIIGGVLLLAGLYFTGQQFVLTSRQFELAESGQITDRFSTAVAQLGEAGEAKTAVRIGGLYALERLSRESKDHAPEIFEVLAAFVRAPHRKEDAALGVPADVQAALSVLGRRTRQPNEEGRLNLRGSWLVGADLVSAQLSYVDLTDANLRGATLINVLLKDSYLIGAHLDGAKMNNADFTEARLNGAFLTGRADLTGAKFIDAELTGADLSGADLTEADLTRADMSGANLTGATISREQVEVAITDSKTRFPWPTASR